MAAPWPKRTMTADPQSRSAAQGAPAEAQYEDAGEESSGRAKVKKAPNAFRTISEVADDLHIPQHVLRFWETKFPQVKPMKRGGGRRYYRPDDIALLRRISDLLYIQGYTIKGVQRLLREGGSSIMGVVMTRVDLRKASMGGGRMSYAFRHYDGYHAARA